MNPIELPAALVQLHAELGIPPNYATSRALPFQPEVNSGELVSAGTTPEGRPIELVASAVAAWQAMCAAAAADGVMLLPLSGFRSTARQTEIVRAKLASGRAIAEILHTVAAPGFSEHHTGRALDIGTPGEPPLEESFAETAAFAWLARHAGRFGFHLSYPRENVHRIAFEPWHWLHRG